MTAVSSPWILDHNIPLAMKRFLQSQTIISVTAKERGWEQLSNGELVAAVVAAGFSVILTQDRRFQESAAKTLRLHIQVSIVLVILPPKVKPPALSSHIATKWAEGQIIPVPGQLVVWGGVLR